MNTHSQAVSSAGVQCGEERVYALNKLKKSPRNVRKVPHTEAEIEARAASIKAKGVLQPPVVEPELRADGAETGYAFVTAGEGRRLALHLLAKRKVISKTTPIRCLVDTVNDPQEVSLDENVSRSAKDAGPEFDKVNLAYGFNGSGKSTLSRIFGCLQTGKAHRELPEDCSFEVEMSDGKTYGAPDNLAGLETRVCVFNADFVAENLQWSTGRAASIFYISQEQADSAAELKAAEATVPGQKQSRVTEEKAAKTLATAFGNHCRDRAKVLYQSLNMQSRKYEANHLKADYEQVAYEATDILSPEALSALEEVARLNAPLPEVALLAAESFRIAGLAGSARGFAEMSIGATMLEEIQNHPSMVAWLKHGHDYHTDHDLKSCLLCGNAFSAERKALLATALDDKIAKLLSDLEVAKQGALDVAELPVLSPDMWPKAVELDPSLQAAYTEALTALSHAADGASKLVMLAQQTLASRQTTPTQSVQHTLPNNMEVGAIAEALDAAVNAVNALIADHNTASLNFNDRQTKAKEDLRKHWLAEGQAAFAAARDAAEEASKALEARDKGLADLDTKIEALRAKVRTHGPAAETITKLIHNYLGHGELSVVAAKEGYELHRHGKLVKGQPSEGEKTAIALCYFLTTLGGDGRALKDLIVVIDDPISSLDSKALNYACTLLLLRLREAGQLIVLTHNWQCMNEFKKAWRRWKKDAALLFLDVTVAEGSTLRSSKLVPMSALLREYDSEYQFLCSKLLEFEATGTAHSPHQFMMPNTMRRVLDVFLAFKVPDTRSFAQKLTKICEDYPQLDTVRIIALERLIQVESHSDNLDDLMGLSPMTIEEVREMNTALLDMIRVADKEHADIIRKIWKPVVAPGSAVRSSLRYETRFLVLLTTVCLFSCETGDWAEMRILHTSDWHLGRTLAQESLLDDQAELLDQVLAAIVEHRVDVLIIAGDLFDRAVPRKEAVQLFNDFLARVYAETGAAIVAIAGNHDAPDRVSFNSALQDPRRVLIRGPLRDRPHALVLSDEHGPVAFSALPYCEIFAAREAFDDVGIASPAHALSAQLAQARQHVPPGARWVVTAHAFVEGGRITETERPLAQVGGIETVPSAMFDGAAYVALGHLHRAQEAGASHIRYSGSWMGFGFDEADEVKSLSLVELDAGGLVQVTEIPMASPRPLRVVTGKLADLVAAGRAPDALGAGALIKAVLTDEGALIDAIGQLRAVYPHVLQLERLNRLAAVGPGAGAAAVDRQDPVKLVASFLDAVRGRGPDDVETGMIDEALTDLESEEV